MSTVIEHVRANIADPEIRKKIYGPIHEELRSGDWDTVDECLGQDPAYDEYVRENHPEWFHDDEDEDADWEDGDEDRVGDEDEDE